MKSNFKKILILIYFGIIFMSSTFNNYNYLDEQDNNGGIKEIQDENNLEGLKTSGYWSTNFIHIDDNWTETLVKPWCDFIAGFYTIENVTIDASGSPKGFGIFINNSKNDLFIIRNCTVYNGWDSGLSYNGGIKLENTCNGTLINNNCSNNNVYGITLYHSHNNTISCNTINNNDEIGICFGLDCENNKILNNTIDDNDSGGIEFNPMCDNNTISGNTIINNGGNAFGLYSGSDNTLSENKIINNLGGISFGFYSHNTIIENIISNNGFAGIYLEIWCSGTLILGNVIKSHQYGIYLYDNCHDNPITENFIYNNNVGISLDGFDFSEYCNNSHLFYNYLFNNSNSNAYDPGSNNWDNGTIGNYWDDYSGVDEDYDGIGDTPYTITGGGDNKDNKPIMIYKALFYELPNDLTYEVGAKGNDIKWIIINPTPHPLTFNVFRDGTSVRTGQLFPTKNEIVINIDDLDIGSYGFTIEISDVSGGSFTDGVWVTVRNTKPTFIATPEDFSYEVGNIGNKLTWIFSDFSTNNSMYTVARNNMPLIINNPCLPDAIIEISVDGLDIGLYCYTIEINDGYGGIITDAVWVSVISSSDSETIDLIFVEITDQSFSTEEFNITFIVYNECGQSIDFSSIQLWWNGTEVSSDIQNHGNGVYFISLEPITVIPGKDPILLSIIVSANGYEDKHFELYLAVDPETLQKEFGRDGDELILTIIIITITSIAVGIAVTTIGLLRRRKLLRKIT